MTLSFGLYKLGSGDGNINNALTIEFKNIPALNGGGRVIKVNHRLLGAFQRLKCFGNQFGSGLN